MLLSLFRWIKGYLLVVIKGYSPERFFNLCSNHKIVIWGLSKTEEGFQFRISIKDFFRIKPIVRKTKTRPRIKKRYGLPIYIKRYKRRKMFFLGLLIGTLLVYYMSLFIWDIQITGQNSHTEETIVEFLKSEGVYAGLKKGEVNCTAIEELLRKKYEDVGWVSAEIRGTRLLIKITETNMPQPFEKPTGPCHFVADRDGLIVDMITRKGTPKVRVGDVVRKGQILVAGIVEIMGDDLTVVKKSAVVADADIVIKTFYNYEDKLSLTYEQKQYTGNSNHYYSFSLFGHEFYLLNPFKNYNKYKNYEHLISEKDLRLNENFYLPVKWTSITNKEYQLVEQTYSEEESLALMTEKLNLYISQLDEQGVKVIENHVVFTMAKDQVIASGKLIVEQKVRARVSVTEEETNIPQESIAPMQ